MNGLLPDRGKGKGFVLLYVLWLSVAVSALVFFVSLRGRRMIRTQSCFETRMALQNEVNGLHKIIVGLARNGGIGGAGYRNVIDRCTVEMTNANSMLNINRSTAEEIMRLCEAVEIPEQHREIIADSILDWIDADQDSRGFGAEDDYYQGLTPPYYTAGRNMAGLDELLLVQGMNRDYLDRLKDHISFDATGINFQQTTPEVTYAVCGDRLMADSLVEYRVKETLAPDSLQMLIGEDVYMSLHNRITFRNAKSNRVTVTGRQGSMEIILTEWVKTN